MDPMKSRRIADLDVVDITQNLSHSRQSLKSRIAKEEDEIRRMDAELEEIAPNLGRALAPSPVDHPAADAQDDNYWFMRALRETGYAARHEDLLAARRAANRLQAELRSLNEFEDPRAEVAKGVIVFGWEYVQDLGLGGIPQRQASSPTSLGGLPLAEILWQTDRKSVV